MEETDNPPPKPKRGFAAMDPERLREISQRGGKAVTASGKGHHYTSEEAARAGKIGGKKVSVDSEHMATIGRTGGQHGAGRPRNRGKFAPEITPPSADEP